MKFFKELNSKKIGTILALLFIIGLVTSTVYSRAYAERRKPLVHIAMPESGAIFWEFETRSTVQPANEYVAAAGFEWMIEVHIPREAFENYVSTLYVLFVQATSDMRGFPENVTFVRRNILGNGDLIYTFGYMSDDRAIMPDEGVTMHLEHRGLTEADGLIPICAVHRDAVTGQNFIFVITRRDGAWGREYVVKRRIVEFAVPAQVRGMANLMLASCPGPIVVWSELPIYDGAIVRIFD